ncbi:hypothetical protein LINGRAHAP2_LOCUS27942 [Linum grandiflorum]
MEWIYCLLDGKVRHTILVF